MSDKSEQDDGELLKVTDDPESVADAADDNKDDENS